MTQEASHSDSSYFLGFDGGGTKTECVLTDTSGSVLAKAFAGPSNPLRAGHMKAWYSLSEAADFVLSRQKIRSTHIRGICAGLGGAGRPGVARSVATFFERGYPNAKVRVTTDFEIAFEAAFGSGEGIVLLAGTGSAAFGRDANGRSFRAGGRGPWFSDEGGAFDIGRRALRAVALAEEHRGPATELSKRIFKRRETREWDSLIEQIAKNPGDVFPKLFPLVGELADVGDAVAREILAGAAQSLAELAGCVAAGLGLRDREVQVAKIGGAHGRSKYFDSSIEEALKKTIPHAHLISPSVSPGEAAARMASQLSQLEGNAA